MTDKSEKELEIRGQTCNVHPAFFPCLDEWEWNHIDPEVYKKVIEDLKNLGVDK